MRGFFLLIGFILVTPAWAIESQLAALERMYKASSELSFEGEMVYEHNGGSEVFHLLHKAGDNKTEECLRSLSGPVREYHRSSDGNETIYLQEERSLIADAMLSGRLLPELDIEYLREGPEVAYRISGGQPGRVAGREVHSVRLIPLDVYRYGYELWLDKETDLLLKSTLMNHRGQALEQIFFTRFQVLDESPELGEPEAGTRQLLGVRISNGEIANRDNWQLKALPSGFKIEAVKSRQVADQAIQQLLVNDGLAQVSVYIEDIQQDRQILGHFSQGAVSAFGMNLGKHQVLVLGLVPPVTVEAIARNLRYQP